MTARQTLAISRLIAATAVEVATQAEISVIFTARLSERVADLTRAVGQQDDISSYPRSAITRSSKICARRVRYIANHATKVMEAGQATRIASSQIYELGEVSDPSMPVLRQAIDDAIKAAGRAERGARIARGYLWESINCALEAAQNRDASALVGPLGSNTVVGAMAGSNHTVTALGSPSYSVDGCDRKT